ncbi:hypothetical protein [Alloscardovia criceti]|uniref:hypothetical protein n=1 Tax=Alloscardovia criceti TaxID=356828 RepID=UPI000377E5CD|nr:hypothetical protein [Alloscardovia criceti]
MENFHNRQGSSDFRTSTSPDNTHNEVRAYNAEQINPVPSRDGYHSTSRVFAVFGASGGCTASSFALYLAQSCAENLQKVCVVDCDFFRGGIDILAGCEETEGLRWHNIQAPLGMVDSTDFGEELVACENFRLLPWHVWRSEAKKWWEIKAIFEALLENFEVVICDCGQGMDSDIARAWSAISQLVCIQPIIISPLTTLSLVRAHQVVEALNSGETSQTRPAGWRWDDPVLFVAPRKSSRLLSKGAALSAYQAEEYLGSRIFGQIPYIRQAPVYEQRGWGMVKLPRSFDSQLQAFVHEYGVCRQEHRTRTVRADSITPIVPSETVHAWSEG